MTWVVTAVAVGRDRRAGGTKCHVTGNVVFFRFNAR